jgi:hypothetical protein
MQPGYREALIQETERHSKLFLAVFELVDKVLRDKELFPKWIAAYNFLCMLNIPRV